MVETKCLVINNAPDVIVNIAKKWQQAGKSFYLGPENVFSFNQTPINYRGVNQFSRDYGSWYVCTEDCMCPKFLELTKSEIEEIAQEFAKNIEISSAFLYTGDVCNLKCKMCGYHGENSDSYKNNFKQERIELDFEIAKRRIDKICEIAKDSLKTFSIISNGEILLNRDWEKMMQYVSNLNLQLYFITNGVLFTKETAQKIKSIGNVCDAQVSLHAINFETWSKITGSSNRTFFENAMNAPLLLKEAGVKNVSVTFVMLEENRCEMKEFIEYWKGKADSIRLLHCITTEENPSNTHYNRSDEPQGFCSNYGTMFVLPSGTIMPCCPSFSHCYDDNKANLGLLNLDRDSVEKIREEFFMKQFDEKFRKLCVNCYSNCRIGCEENVTIAGYPAVKSGISYHINAVHRTQFKKLKLRLKQVLTKMKGLR